ncbi:MAG: NAD(P)/FAD-dependent oxidoreductase [Candidatus Binatia bacterium]
MEASAAKKRILILGGGFAGAYTALHLERQLRDAPDIEIALVARENFVLFTPMLAEVAGCDLEVTDIVQPLRKMLRHSRVMIADAESIDLVKKQVRIRHSGLAHTYDIPYDQLVLALGAVTNFYRTPGLEEHALTMKTLGDAILIRNRVIDALGVADNVPDETERKTRLTIVVAGAGFAGVETAGAVNDLLREAMKFYAKLTPDMARVVVVHPGEVILPELSESLGRYAEKRLALRGVEIRPKAKVTGYDGNEVSLDDGTKIATRVLIWTAGITPPPLLASLPCAIQRGRVVANDCLQVPNWPGVWALGDCALVPDPLNPGKFYPPTAQHAIRQAATLAGNIVSSMRGQSLQPFKFKIIGLLAVIGRRHGVAEILGWQFSGLIAWCLWRAIYLSKLPGLQKKVRVAIDWMLDLIFSKDLVQLPTLRSATISEAESSSTGTNGSSKTK